MLDWTEVSMLRAGPVRRGDKRVVVKVTAVSSKHSSSQTIRFRLP